jgi:hypothetical protein
MDGSEKMHSTSAKEVGARISMVADQIWLAGVIMYTTGTLVVDGLDLLEAITSPSVGLAA